MEIEESDINIALLKKYIHYAKCKISPRLTEVLNILNLKEAS
jgi:hypothetical protein